MTCPSNSYHFLKHFCFVSTMIPTIIILIDIAMTMTLKRERIFFRNVAFHVLGIRQSCVRIQGRQILKKVVSLFNNLSSCTVIAASVTRWLVNVLNLGHSKLWNFCRKHKFCQILNKPSKIDKVFKKFATVAKFPQIWSRWLWHSWHRSRV